MCFLKIILNGMIYLCLRHNTIGSCQKALEATFLKCPSNVIGDVLVFKHFNVKFYFSQIDQTLCRKYQATSHYYICTRKIDLAPLKHYLNLSC
jgi:hypothetical protein